MKTVFKALILNGVVLSVIFMYLYYNNQFWTHYKTDNFETLVEYNGENIKG